MSHGSVPKGEVPEHKTWAEATMKWHKRLLLQLTLCPASCPKKPPHIHVTQERVEYLRKLNPVYERMYQRKAVYLVSN